jgi:hypothetical protein
LHEEGKLRTVIWQFTEMELSQTELAQISNLTTSIDREYLKSLLSKTEIDALFARLAKLLEDGRFPSPNPNWPAVPWPPY